MRVVGFPLATLALLTSTIVQIDDPSKAQQPPAPAGQLQSKRDKEIADQFRYESTGLSILRPYTKGKIPVVFVHGLWSSPCSWRTMIESLEADETLQDRFQFWTFGYSTGDPLPYTALLLRRNLENVRKTFDPERQDETFDNMVVVGHSMGGLLTKMMVQETGEKLWGVVSTPPSRAPCGRGERPGASPHAHYSTNPFPKSAEWFS